MIWKRGSLTSGYDDWEIVTQVIIISTDDSRSCGKVPSFVNGKGWEFDSYLDKNGDFRRAMNVLSNPHVLVFDKKGEIIFNQSSYHIGDEEVIYSIIEKSEK